MVIKTEPNFEVKVENGEDQLQTLQEITIKNSERNYETSNHNILKKLNVEKTQLLSDVLALKEDYERVCTSLNKKNAECLELKKKLVAVDQKLEMQCDEIARLQMELKTTKDCVTYDTPNIVGHKIILGVLNFLIRWEISGSEQSTSNMVYSWERKENLNHCEQMLKTYMTHNNLI